VRDGRHVLSNVIATQHELHERYRGVVPEIASRAHLERIVPVIRAALVEAGVGYGDLDAIAVGHRPGLIGSLLVGVSAAKALAWSLNVPLVGVDHVLAHLYAGLLESDEPTYPALGLVVSGGHSSLFLVQGPLEVQLIGRTIDDAVGEAFDKAATILELGYPGGPQIDRLAREGNDQAHQLPVARLEGDRLDFSFSGLKTALLYAVRGNPVGRGRERRFPRDAALLDQPARADFAASFERAAVDAVMLRLEQSLDRHAATTLLVGGGVSANTLLRQRLTTLAQCQALDLRLPPMAYCLDNAAMIGGLAARRLAAGEQDDLTLNASPRSAVGSA
jgi:N6-L-threonylcarbamoyladenine synthase